MDRKTALDQIRQVNQEREALIDQRGDQYANQEDTLVTFKRAAQICNSMDISITASNIATVLLAVKLARLAQDPLHWDSILDGHNYIDLAYLCNLEAFSSGLSH